MTQQIIDDLELEAAKLKCEYDHLVTKGHTSEAMDVFHGKWQPALAAIVTATDAMFSEKCKSQKLTSSKLNKKLFSEALPLLIGKSYKPETWHCGKVELGNLIDYLETNYVISPR